MAENYLYAVTTVYGGSGWRIRRLFTSDAEARSAYLEETQRLEVEYINAGVPDCTPSGDELKRSGIYCELTNWRRAGDDVPEWGPDVYERSDYYLSDGFVIGITPFR